VCQFLSALCVSPCSFVMVLQHVVKLAIVRVRLELPSCSGLPLQVVLVNRCSFAWRDEMRVPIISGDGHCSICSTRSVRLKSGIVSQCFTNAGINRDDRSAPPAAPAQPKGPPSTFSSNVAARKDAALPRPSTTASSSLLLAHAKPGEAVVNCSVCLISRLLVLYKRQFVFCWPSPVL
jgi:hypothetical protein